MDRDVLVPLLKAVVLADVMQVVASDNNGPLHLHFGHHTREDTATDGDISSEGAFLVNISAINSLSWGFEAQSDTLVVAGELLLGLLATISDQNTLLVLEDGGLLLISPLGLCIRHLCLPSCKEAYACARRAEDHETREVTSNDGY